MTLLPAALTVWAAGMPIAYAMSRDPTGTRGDRLRAAAVWPLLMIVLTVIGAAWAIGKVYVAVTRLRRMIPC